MPRNDRKNIIQTQDNTSSGLRSKMLKCAQVTFSLSNFCLFSVLQFCRFVEIVVSNDVNRKKKQNSHSNAFHLLLLSS